MRQREILCWTFFQWHYCLLQAPAVNDHIFRLRTWQNISVQRCHRRPDFHVCRSKVQSRSHRDPAYFRYALCVHTYRHVQRPDCRVTMKNRRIRYGSQEAGRNRQKRRTQEYWHEDSTADSFMSVKVKSKAGHL